MCLAQGHNTVTLEWHVDAFGQNFNAMSLQGKHTISAGQTEVFNLSNSKKCRLMKC